MQSFMMASGQGEASAAKTSALPGSSPQAHEYKNIRLTTPENQAKPAESASVPKTGAGPSDAQRNLPLNNGT